MAHLLLDGLHNGTLSGGEEVRDLLHRWIQRLLAELQMQPFGTRQILPNGEDWIASQLTGEGHISLHAKPTGGVWACIFSCKPFDVEEARDLTIEMLGLVGWNSQVIEGRIPFEGER